MVGCGGLSPLLYPQLALDTMPFAYPPEDARSDSASVWIV